MTWIRFTVAAGTPEDMQKSCLRNLAEVFDNAMKNISYAVELKKLNLNVTLGIQMVLTPEMSSEIIPFAKLAINLGVDYGVIKHCSDDEFGTLGIDYENMNKCTSDKEASL